MRSRWSAPRKLSAYTLYVSSVPDGRAANQPDSVVTFRPPIAAPLPGAVVSTPVTDVVRQYQEVCAGAVAKHGGTYGVTMELVINDDADQILNRTPRGRTVMRLAYEHFGLEGLLKRKPPGLFD